MAFSRVQDKESVLKDALKAKAAPGGVWLLCGPESYLSGYYLSLLRKKVIPDPDMGYFDHVRLSGSERSTSVMQDAGEPLSLAERLRDACAGLPVMNEGKLVEIAEPAFSDMSPNALKDFCDAAASVPDYPYVTVVSPCAEEEFPTDYRAVNSPLWKALEAAGVNIVPFAMQSEQKLLTWCARHFASEGISADAAVISAMLRRCGCSMAALSGEMRKLCFYEKAHNRTAVSMEDMILVTAPSEEAKEFGVQSAVRARDAAALLRECAVAKHAKEEPISVFFQISSALSELWRVSSARADGMPREEMMRLFKMKEYPLKLALQACSNYTPGELQTLVDRCAETDVALKSSPVDGWILVERLACLTAVRADG